MENKVITGLKALLDENSSAEMVEKVGAIIKDAEEQGTQMAQLVAKNEEIRTKYIDSITHGSVSQQEEAPREDSPKSFEDCINDVIKARK